MKFLQKLPNATKKFATKLVLASRFIVDDALGCTKYGNTKPSQNMGDVSVSTVRSATGGTDTTNSPDGRLSINVFQMNLYAFVLTGPRYSLYVLYRAMHYHFVYPTYNSAYTTFTFDL